ncbi:leukocyte elastase inhibitor-like [Rhincodon typus]|uniref:leukocyte elastase inhibitor-like n=1 Tax=Rhincodon typus TaxID=259920 RepID=UPI00202FBF94|nr:leukocyte elastase inhibitor-like [Rhincodon typus]
MNTDFQNGFSVANTKFAVALFKKLKENENIFLSPLSISTALAMVYLGAKGNTATEMAEVREENGDGDVHPRFKELTAAINDRDKPYLLKLANCLFGEETYTFLEKFQNSASEFYGSQLATVSFQSQPEAARKVINSWVGDKTEGKIQNILPEGIITPLTKLVLVNAIYFKGKWNRKFSKNDTYIKSFWLNKRETKPITMMSQEGEFYFGYIEELQTKVLELPYVQNELSLIILLPDGINDNSTGLEQVTMTVRYGLSMLA